MIPCFFFGDELIRLTCFVCLFSYPIHNKKVTYGLALVTIANTMIDFQTFYSQTVQEILYPILPISILPNNLSSPLTFVTLFNTILTMQLKKFILVSWIALVTSIVLGCIYRTAKHINHFGRTAVALTKFASPILVASMVLFLTPEEAIHQEARFISIAAGLCFCFITLKLIVFGMAHMAYASIQADILPLLLVLGFITWEYDYASQRRLTPLGLTFLLQCVTVYYLLRAIYWTHVAIHQLCERLDVYLFIIKQKHK